MGGLCIIGECHGLDCCVVMLALEVNYTDRNVEAQIKNRRDRNREIK